jgi:hypothetical protein
VARLKPKKGEAKNESAFERLTKTHPDLEIWWDASPLVYYQWVREMILAAEPSHKPILEEQLARLFKTDGGYASKMLACSMRVGSLVAGKVRFWDVEKLAGGDIVYTCPPYVLEPVFEIGDELDLRSEINEDPPGHIVDKLLKIPFCIQAYDPNGLELEQFNVHPSPVSTVETFSKGFTDLEGFIHDRMTVRH